MKTGDFKTMLFAVGLVGAVGVSPLSAQLPSLTEKDLLGFFALSDSKSHRFGIGSDGKATLKVIDSKGNPVSNQLDITVYFIVEETMPGGKVVSRRFLPEAWETTDPATTKLKDLSFKGKVTGDIGFEVFVTEERGAISLGGRLLNPAGLKNPARFAIEMAFPNAMPKPKANADDDKKAAKELADAVKDDRVQLVWTDGKKAKISGDEEVEGSSKEVTGPGISAAVIEFSAFKGRKVQLSASANSSMHLTNPSKRSLVQGFSLVWSADPAKDPEAKARVSLDVR